MTCRRCGREIAEGSRFCPACGAPAPGRAAVAGGGSTASATVIPYQNAPALIGYYLGVFSLIPCVGLLLVPVAIPLGIVGLRRASRDSQAKGKVHVWIAISLATLSVAIHV